MAATVTPLRRPTEAAIRAELADAFIEHRRRPGKLEAALAAEVRFATDRYTALLDEPELNMIALLAVRDAVVAARIAIIEKVAHDVADGRATWEEATR